MDVAHAIQARTFQGQTRMFVAKDSQRKMHSISVNDAAKRKRERERESLQKVSKIGVLEYNEMRW